jgi:hypothetical protein
MQFNDTTDLNGLIQSCEEWSRLGKAQISGNTDLLKRFTRLINNTYHKSVTSVLESMDGWDFDDPNHGDTGFIKTYNLTADQQQVTLPLSDKILKIKRAEITYDGGTWYRAMPIDINEYGGVSTQSAISGHFEVSNPFYDMIGNYVYLYPVPESNVTGGLKIWVSREIDEFTSADTTQEPGIAEPFHEMLAIGASRDYAVQEGLNNAADLSAVYADYEARLRRFYGSRQEDRHMVMKPNNEWME